MEQIKLVLWGSTVFAAMLMHVSMSKGLKKNSHSFLEPSHTHMKAATIYALIEKYKKSTFAIIEVPRNWSNTHQSYPQKK